jgi:hypothetical protein
VTLKVVLLGLPAASDAAHATTEVPTAKTLAETGRQRTDTLPSIASWALTLKPTGAPAALVASAKRSGVGPNIGAAVSVIESGTSGGMMSGSMSV